MKINERAGVKQYAINIKKEKKVIYIKLAHEVTTEEAFEISRFFWFSLSIVGKGVIVVCDISDFSSASGETLTLLQKLMKVIDDYDPRGVIRIISSEEGEQTFARVHSIAKVNYQVYLAKNKERAESIVERLSKLPIYEGIPFSLS